MNDPPRRGEPQVEGQDDPPITWREVFGWAEVLGWTILAMWPFLLVIHGSAVSTDQSITRYTVLVGAVGLIVGARLWSHLVQRQTERHPQHESATRSRPPQE